MVLLIFIIIWDMWGLFSPFPFLWIFPFALPYTTILFNRTPGLDLTGFKGEVVVLDTSAGLFACKKVFKTASKCGKNRPTKLEQWICKSRTMAFEVHLVLHAVRVSRTVGILNTEMLKWKDPLQRCLFLHPRCYCLESFRWPLTSAQCPCFWS